MRNFTFNNNVISWKSGVVFKCVLQPLCLLVTWLCYDIMGDACIYMCYKTHSDQMNVSGDEQKKIVIFCFFGWLLIVVVVLIAVVHWN